MNLLDRYIIRQFLFTLVFSLAALCVIFLVVNLLEQLDDFIDQDAAFEIIAEYYIYFFPEILKLLTPIAMLLSTLFTVGRMSTANEVTAMKSGGLSLYRLMLPLAILSIFISFGQLYFNGWIVPEANTKKLEIEHVYLKKGSGGGPIYNLYFRDSPKKNVTMRYYNSNNKTGSRVSIDMFTSTVKPRLIKRTEADKIAWDSTESQWTLYNGIVRQYKGGREVSSYPFDSTIAEFKVSHQQIVQLQRSPDEMNLDELKNYIDLLKQGGKDVRQQLTAYYGEYAFPFANFIVILFGVPFASVRKKGGIAIQIGAAMVISFLYLLFTKIGQTIGYASDFNPIISAWLANILFFIAGLINLFRTKT